MFFLRNPLKTNLKNVSERLSEKKNFFFHDFTSMKTYSVFIYSLTPIEPTEPTTLPTRNHQYPKILMRFKKKMEKVSLILV